MAGHPLADPPSLVTAPARAAEVGPDGVVLLIAFVGVDSFSHKLGRADDVFGDQHIEVVAEAPRHPQRNRWESQSARTHHPRPGR